MCAITLSFQHLSQFYISDFDFSTVDLYAGLIWLIISYFMVNLFLTDIGLIKEENKEEDVQTPTLIEEEDEEAGEAGD